jgi:ABC-type branched-subunit amino acid transport system substrate-binding protein
MVGEHGGQLVQGLGGLDTIYGDLEAVRTVIDVAPQGPILGVIGLLYGHERVAILARGDDYGRGLADATRQTLEEAGAEVVMEEIYDPGAVTFDAEASATTAADPDAVVTIPFEEGVALLQALLEVGFSPDQLYGADGIRSAELNESVDPADPNVIDGFKGTAPDPGAVPGFVDRLLEFDPDLEETIFAPQAYDCGIVIGLAMASAGTTDPATFRDHIVPLSRGENECTGFEECAQLLQDGQTIRYQFASGIIEKTDVGEPINGSYEVWEWQDAGLQSIDTREITLDQ